MKKLNASEQQTNDMLELIFERFHHRHFVDPDPLIFLYDYDHVADREIVGLIAACLAYGRVTQILKSIRIVLAPMEKSPYNYLLSSSPQKIDLDHSGFKHRFADSSSLSGLLCGISGVLKEYGSLENCFNQGLLPDDPSIRSGLTHMVRAIQSHGLDPKDHLLPNPAGTSASKRLYLYLRWMIRCDEIDPGGWDEDLASKLIVPLDVHMFRIGSALKFTTRKSADLKTAMEITEGFRRFSPDDPVKFDFSLTRLGIHPDIDTNLMDIIGSPRKAIRLLLMSSKPTQQTGYLKNL